MSVLSEPKLRDGAMSCSERQHQVCGCVGAAVRHPPGTSSTSGTRRAQFQASAVDPSTSKTYHVEGQESFASRRPAASSGREDAEEAELCPPGSFSRPTGQISHLSSPEEKGPGSTSNLSMSTQKHGVGMRCPPT